MPTTLPNAGETIAPNPPQPAPQSPGTLALEVMGMKCAGCVQAVEKRLKQQPGVLGASVNLVTQVATVDYIPGETDGDRLAQMLTAGGFPSQRRDRAIRPTPDDRPDAAALQASRQKLALATLLLVLSSLGHVEQFLGWTIPGWDSLVFHWALATLTLGGPGRSIWLRGFQGLRQGVPTMDTLVGLGAWSAYGASCMALGFPGLGWECFFDEPVMLLGFILLGRTLEQRARHRAGASLRKLLELQPPMARLVVDGVPETPKALGLLQGKVVEVASDRLRVGELLRVLPGEKFPVDGRVVAGYSTVDEALLTGEALPVVKQRDDRVTAGSLNLSGVVVVESTQVGQETTLAQIIDLVETAQGRKAPIQRLADRVAGYFTYGVMAIAALTLGFWLLVGTHLWPQVLHHHEAWMMGMDHGAGTAGATVPLVLSLKLAIAVLVIACPCALGLATPMAMLVGSSLGAEKGLLIRGGDVLEQLDGLTTIVLDKTGTLTLGHPQVTDTWVNPDWVPTLSPATLLQWAASLEAGTCHPLALAIAQAAQAQGLPPLPTTHFHTEPGLGVSGHIAGVPTFLGNGSWLQHQGISLESGAIRQGERWAQAGNTVIYVAQAGAVVGAIAIADPLRPDAAATLQQLRQRGLGLLMVTGDRATTAQAIAQDLPLTPQQIHAEVRPAEKAALIRQLQAQGQRVAMVGDGINDAPALAQADVGIALQGGTQVAMETAAIVLMGDRLGQVLEALDLGKATLTKIRQNLFWALAYNILAIPIAAGILLPLGGFALSPGVAGALMAFSSITVVTNSLLLRRGRGE